MDLLKTLLARALDLAQSLSASSAWNDQHGGMASVKLIWNPYEGSWEASASWSGGHELASEGSLQPDHAVTFLITILESEIRALKAAL
jgi:hypothetical protein